MSKSVRNLIWTLTAVVLIIFSDWWIKSDVASRIVNIIGCLILMKQLMKMFQRGLLANSWRGCIPSRYPN